MYRAALFVLLFLALTSSASASTQVTWQTWDFPPIWGNTRHILVDGGDGANHDIVVKPSGAQQLGGFPQKVEVYDYGDTITQPAPDPYGINHPCFVDSPHHATCAASGGPVNPADPYSYLSYSTINIGTGNGNDTINASDPLNPMGVSVGTGAGDDNVTISGMWGNGSAPYGISDSLGDGNDVAHIGPAPLWIEPIAGEGGGTPAGTIFGRMLSGGRGDDTIDTLNGAIDHISCGDGNDTWQSDPQDDQQTSGFNEPPDTNGDCETRTPPALP